MTPTPPREPANGSGIPKLPEIPPRASERPGAAKPAPHTKPTPAAAKPAGAPQAKPQGKTDPKPADPALLEAGQQIVVALCAVIRIGRSHDSANQAFKLQLRNFAAGLTPVLAKHSEVVLVVVDGELYMNGARIPVNSFSFRFHRTVVESFKQAHIAGLRVSARANPVELGKFIELLLDADGPKGKAMVEACAAAGFTHTQPALYSHDEHVTDAAGAADPSMPATGRKSLYKTLHEAAGGRSSQKRLTDIMQGAQAVLSPSAIQSGVELRLAKRVVQPLVDAAASSEPLLVGLSVIQDPDRNAYGHAINVAGIAVAVGHAFGLDRIALADLGVAALYHDIGISTLALRRHDDDQPLTDDERAELRRHTIEGAKLLASTTTLSKTSLRSMRVVLEHHVREGRAGYPELPNYWKTSVLSRIVSIADGYVSLLNRRRADGTRVTPTVALGMILGPLQSRFEAPLLRALVQSLGFYPPGQGLELSDGSLAVAIAPNRADLTRPHAMVVTDEQRRLLPEHHRKVLRPLPRGMTVVRALSAEELPLGPDAGDERTPLDRAA